MFGISGLIEYNNLKSAYKFDDVMKLKEDVYFLGGVKDPSKRNKDDDIIEKNYFVVDFDIRENHKHKHNKIMQDDGLFGYYEIIKQKLDNNDYFKEYSAIVFSGNGYHIYYVGDNTTIDKNIYKAGVEYIYKQIDTIFDDDVIRCDHTTKNIARIIRIPGSINYGRKRKFNLEPLKTETLDEKNTKSRLVGLIEKFGQKQSEKEIIESAQSHIKYTMREIKDDVLQDILDIDIIDLVANISGLQPQNDMKNFKSPKDGKNVGMFVFENVLYITGTHYVDTKYKGYNSFLFIRENKGFSNNETFQRFKDNYPQIKRKSEETKKEWVQEMKQKPERDIWLKNEKAKVDHTKKVPFTWGVDVLDKKFAKPGHNDLVLLVGNPNMGKTEFSYFMARQNAMKGIKVAYFSLELSQDMLYQRTARKLSGISYFDFQDKTYSKKQADKFDYILNDLEESSVVELVGIKKSPTINELESKILEYKDRGYEMFFIDNLGKIDRGGQSEIDGFDEITSKLQDLKDVINCPIILLHHTKKGGKQDTKPMPAGCYGFRGSQKIYDNCTIFQEIRRDIDDKESGSTTMYQYKHTWEGITGEEEIFYTNGDYNSTGKKTLPDILDFPG